MMSDLIYTILGSIVLIILAAVAIYNLIAYRCYTQNEDQNDDLLAEICVDEDYNAATWRDFQARHVITNLQSPGHRKWNSKAWSAYLRKQNIELFQDSVHSIISVEEDYEIISDFNPLQDSARDNNFVMDEVLPRYKSQNSRILYHFLGDSQGNCKVFKGSHRYMTNVRCVRICPNIISDLRVGGVDPDRVLWVPVSLEKLRPPQLKLMKRIP